MEAVAQAAVGEEDSLGTSAHRAKGTIGPRADAAQRVVDFEPGLRVEVEFGIECITKSLKSLPQTGS